MVEIICKRQNAEMVVTVLMAGKLKVGLMPLVLLSARLSLRWVYFLQALILLFLYARLTQDCLPEVNSCAVIVIDKAKFHKHVDVLYSSILDSV